MEEMLNCNLNKHKSKKLQKFYVAEKSFLVAAAFD